MKKEIFAKTIYNKEIAKDIYELKILAEPKLSFIPGQFVHVKINRADLLLRRPISVNSYDEKSGELVLLYKIMGKGTEILSTTKDGETISILAMLGKGFIVKDGYKKIFLVGGGIGCAPLMSIIDKHPDIEYIAFLGFDTKASVYQEKEFNDKSKALYISTDDGSYGHHGFITQPLDEVLKTNKPDVIFACGPMPMLNSVRKVVEPLNIKTYISVEERMGCGVGGCNVCVCKTKHGNKKACVDGPVFELSEVVF